ncbi:LysR family transcriptional regulator [Limibacillus halophilus]|uniref:DNA-binding transcriptional LysR family regulator n=1 Tax=Limibacillus halophilus TaxID=1579333 RepID=A0A839SWU9_9PROT|nr:LysR family transcriptional regulator [Limibacillus halophilus]MBB3065996.1 DNA-binding transcriptional LysR family regulator [Limibacillus halophilus]
MNFRQLETLYWATRLGSLIAASERLNATQSTVSMRIQELENEFGIELFDRSQRTARVTPKGREMARYAEEILALASSMRENLAAPSSLPGLMRIGVAEVVSATWLPNFVTNVRRQYPKISIEFDEALTQNLIDGLESGDLDIIFIAGRAPGRELTTMSLGFVDMNWAASPEISLPNRRLKARDLEKHPTITLTRESHHYEQIEKWFVTGGARFRRPFTCKSLNVCIQLASAGLGVTLVPAEFYPQAFVEKRLHILETSPEMPPVEFNAVYRDNHLQSAAVVLCQLAQKASSFRQLALRDKA